ncbi:MAG TPA: site-specific integrase [Actinophytocola sp.]|uniref:site-specific integrase n=1 Tax=Actinophytocola sp. TaxID=1872138 RepID=UPI002DDCC1B3|nr:site-specific integrase [Actinophytocola sp.]HEV2777890.1 site-specific integrase [Actinophytocola sp.]
MRALLALGKTEEDGDAIAVMLDGLGKDEPIPSLDEVRRKLKSGQDLTEKLTVGDWLDNWLKQEQGSHRRATAVFYEGHVRMYLKPLIGHIRIDRLTVGHLVEMDNKILDANDAIVAANEDRRTLLAQIKATSKRAEKRRLREQLDAMPPFRRPVGPTSRQRIRATLRAAINDAITQQRCTFNPASHWQIPAKKPRPIIWTAERVEEWRRTGLRPSPVMVWTPTLAGAFLDYVAEQDPDFEPLWHLAVKRGLRRGELAGLPWTEIDLDAATLTVSMQLTEVEYEIEEGAPKSAAGERTIPLDAETVQLLRAHRTRQRKERLRLGGAWVESGKVFTRPNGSALRPSWIGDQFEKLYTAAGLPPLRLHDTRHTAATLMLAAGIDLKIIQSTLGHSALATTSDLYTSVLPQVAQAAAEATAAILPRAPRGTLGHPSGTHEAVAGLSTRGGDTPENQKPQLDGGLSAV